MSNLLPDLKLKILEAIEKHRFLTGRQIGLLFNLAGEEKIKVFAELCQTGLMDVIDLPFFIIGQDENRVFCLTRKGAQTLSLKQEKPVESFNYTTPASRKRSLLFLEHNICLNEMALCLENLNNPETEVLSFEKEPERFHFKVFVKSEKKRIERVPLIPDAFFKIKCKEKEHLFFAEIDRGTVNLGRMGLRFLAYLTLWKQRHFERVLGTRNLRILIITTSQKRLSNLMEQVKKIEGGQGLFWFTTQENILLEEPDKILKSVWQTAKSQEQTLF